MAAGPDGRLWLSIPRDDGTVLALLDNTGKPSPAWPILLPGVDGCHLLLPAADGYIRAVCSVRGEPGVVADSVARAYSFDANAQSMPGWPVDIKDGTSARTVGDDLAMLVNPLRNVGGEPGQTWPVSLLLIGTDGTRRSGVEVPFPCCDSDWAIGPDGRAYGTTHRWNGATPVATDVLGFDLDGKRSGWPVTIDGNTSELAFGPNGWIYMVVGSANASPSHTVVLDPDGKVLATSSADLPIASTGRTTGAGPGYPGPPIVAADGTAFMVSTQAGTTIQALGPTGQPLTGWPYRSKVGLEWTGFCGGGDTGCGQDRTDPAVGKDNVLYALQAAASDSAGGTMMAIGMDGQVRKGWPVGLKRAGSMFWSMALAPSGGIWALAIEPESSGFSATILSIAEDSTILFAATVVEP